MIEIELKIKKNRELWENDDCGKCREHIRFFLFRQTIAKIYTKTSTNGSIFICLLL